MMRNSKVLSLLFTVYAMFFLLSCTTPTESELPTLNFQKLLSNNTEFVCQEKIEVLSVIPLETSDTILLADIMKIVVADDLLFILDTEYKLRQFDMQGRFIREIGREGQGPEEYTMLADFTINSDRNEVYVSSMLKVVVYDYEGVFKRNIDLEDDNLQVLTYSNDNLFFIFPDKSYPEGVNSATLVSVLDVDGNLQKEFPVKKMRRVGDFPFFNNIATDGESVFYKEEMGKTLYAIRKDLSVDSIAVLDVGIYSFQPEDFEFSKQEVWNERYRLQNILPTDDFMVFIFQKGLIGEEFEPFLWNRNDNSVCRFDYKVAYQGNDLLVMPKAVSDNKVIGVLASPENEVESDNPVLVVLGIGE